MNSLVRRRNAMKKRKLTEGGKSKSTDTEDDSALDDEGIDQTIDIISVNIIHCVTSLFHLFSKTFSYSN